MNLIQFYFLLISPFSVLTYGERFVKKKKKRFEAVFQCHFRLTALTSIKLNSYLFNTYPVPGATLSAGQPQT